MHNAGTRRPRPHNVHRKIDLQLNDSVTTSTDRESTKCCSCKNTKTAFGTQLNWLRVFTNPFLL